MSRTTTALVVPELNGTFELQEVYLNTLQPDEVLVEIHASGVCHTDLSCSTGVLPCVAGAVLGHEGAGVVLDMGSAVTHVAPGDKVLLSFSYCETCPQCKAGHPAYCYTMTQRNFGGIRPVLPAKGYALPTHAFIAPFEHKICDPPHTSMSTAKGGRPIFSSFFGQSSFARNTIAQRSSVVKVPADTDLEVYASLGCGMQTGAGAVLNSLNVRAGSSVAVFGVGSVGMAAVMAAAKIAGASTVIAIDLQQSRLDLAVKLGATHGVLGGSSDVAAQIRKICEPALGVDYAVDCSGVPAVVNTMIESLGIKGRASAVGAPGPGKYAQVEIMNHLGFGREFVGCTEGDSNPSEFIPFLMKMHQRGQFPLDQFTTFYDVADFKQAFEDTKSGKAIKAVLRWGNVKA
ncbi:chaperonin 10-like protein [Bombardia bombarda]|uniref:Chaperonin 10-like protein n=1 Tax=Bombardia bombarda TaxID=252184 RepID=A0AA39XAH4_9PEZI|nr:chaperonin 10-like protein [Bombardia bombarda]